MTTAEKIIDFINTYKAEHGYAPTKADIARALNTSRQLIQHNFRTMPELAIHPEYRKYFKNKKTG